MLQFEVYAEELIAAFKSQVAAEAYAYSYALMNGVDVLVGENVTVRQGEGAPDAVFLRTRLRIPGARKTGPALAAAPPRRGRGGGTRSRGPRAYRLDG